MNIIYDKTFDISAKKLIKKSNLTQKLIDKAIQFLKDNPSYPSLEFKHITCKIKKNYYSIRVTINHRILLRKVEDNYILEQVVDHKTYDRLTKPQNC